MALTRRDSGHSNSWQRKKRVRLLTVRLELPPVKAIIRLICCALAPLAAFGEDAISTAEQSVPQAAKALAINEREIVTRLQIFLDQKCFGPGIIDGRWGEFTGKAL